MIPQDDDLVVRVEYRINRRAPFGIRWAVDRELNEEELCLLYNAADCILKASRAAQQPLPARTM